MTDDPIDAQDGPRSTSRCEGFPLDAFSVVRSILGPSKIPQKPMVEGYAVQEFIAEGGLGQVWRARCIADGSAVALKIPHRADPEMVERLLAEAETLGSLHHPNIVEFQDLTETESGLPVLVMELIEGSTLSAHLTEGGFDLEHALEIYFPVLDAVGHAHSHSILHRDLKPSNILIAADGAVKVSDFGLARPVQERVVAFSFTRSGAVAGTVEYLAPECYKPGYFPARPADIFALGTLLYELLTGAPPRGAWKPPSQIKRLDVRLDELISETIDPDPARRPPTAQSLRKRLEEIKKAKPRYAGTPLVNRATRAVDFAWTCVGLYFCAAGFCSVLALSRTPVPGVLDLTFGAPGLLIGGWLAVWTLSLGMGALWIWQIIRLWIFRRVPLRERLPSPFGARLGTSTTAAILVGVTQFLCAWLPVIYALRIMGLSFHWRNDQTPIWNDALVVVQAEGNKPVTPWTWDPEKMFDGGAYRLEQTTPKNTSHMARLADKTSFYTFVQPALMALSGSIVGIGMVWTLACGASSWWPHRRPLFLTLSVSGGVSALLIAKIVVRDLDHTASVTPMSPEQRVQLENQVAVEHWRETINRAFRESFLHDRSAAPAALNLQIRFDKNFAWQANNISSSRQLEEWRIRDEAQAMAEHRHHERLNYSHGTMVPRENKPPIMAHEWRYLRFTEAPGKLAIGERVEVKLNAMYSLKRGISIYEARTKIAPIYSARQLPLDVGEAESFVLQFAKAVAVPGAPDLTEMFAEFVIADSMRINALNAMQHLQSERSRWSEFVLSLAHPLEAPVKLPGARWRVHPVFVLLATRPGSSTPDPPVTLRFTFDLAHVNDQWRIVGYWFQPEP